MNDSRALVARLPLLPLDAFSGIAAVLGQKSIWFTVGPGNAGDTLINAGTHCLFRKIGTRIVERSIRPDFLVWGGGGNIGTIWQGSYKRRQREFACAIAERIPIVVLPQSATDAAEPMPDNTHFFAREKHTQALYPNSALAPDLALAFDDDLSEDVNYNPLFPMGVFLREDLESHGEIDLQLSIGDPAKLGRTYRDYFRLISDYAEIATDRLHFAIAALIMGRKAVLLPNSYYKNTGVYDAWLRPLGCGWGTEAMRAMLNKHSYNPEALRKHCEDQHPSTKR
jgi:hypothetical protein